MGPSLQSSRVLIFLGKQGQKRKSGSLTQEPSFSGCISLKIKKTFWKKKKKTTEAHKAKPCCLMNLEGANSFIDVLLLEMPLKYYTV